MLANMGNPSDQALVEFRVIPHDIKDGVGAFQQARQDVIDVVDRERVIRTVDFDSAFLSRATTIPGFFFRVFLATEQYVFTMFTTGLQYHYSIGLVEPGQVQKVAILAKREMRIAIADQFRGRRQNRNGVLAHHFHQLAAATFKFSCFHLLL